MNKKTLLLPTPTPLHSEITLCSIKSIARNASFDISLNINPSKSPGLARLSCHLQHSFFFKNPSQVMLKPQSNPFPGLSDYICLLLLSNSQVMLNVICSNLGVVYTSKWRGKKSSPVNFIYDLQWRHNLDINTILDLPFLHSCKCSFQSAQPTERFESLVHIHSCLLL